MCKHENRLKLLIVKQMIDPTGPHSAGYFICLDCNDYIVTGWVDITDVWTTRDLYAMTKIHRDEKPELTPIQMFLEWIRSDLRHKSGEVLPPR